MALSFEESKKLLSQKIAKPMMMAATPASMSVNDNSIMTLAAEDDMELIPAYSEWTKSNKYVWSDQYTDSKASYVDENKNITVDNSQINLTQEENSQFIPFEMSDMKIRNVVKMFAGPMQSAVFVSGGIMI